MSYTIITDSNDRVLYVSQHIDTVAYKYKHVTNNKIYTLEDEQIPQDLAMWRHEHTMYSELSGWVESEARLAQELDIIREVRDIELGKTDWITIKHMETKQNLPVDYVTYREWLRDLPETYDNKKVLTSPITAVTGSWMNPNIVKELQPWTYIQDVSGTAGEYIPPITSRATITIPASAFDEGNEETIKPDTDSLLASIRELSASDFKPEEGPSSVIIHKNTIKYQSGDDECVEICTRTWPLSS